MVLDTVTSFSKFNLQTEVSQTNTKPAPFGTFEQRRSLHFKHCKQLSKLFRTLPPRSRSSLINFIPLSLTNIHPRDFPFQHFLPFAILSHHLLNRPARHNRRRCSLCNIFVKESSLTSLITCMSKLNRNGRNADL